jgi:hypothetical protein
VDDVEKAAALSVSFRTAITAIARSHGVDDKPHIVYSALSYELAAVIAKHSRSLADAHFAIADIVREMRSQINRLGVNCDHP